MTPKPKELLAVQALVTLPESNTSSNQNLQMPSMDAAPLQYSVLIPSSSKVEEVITYGSVILDEEIVLQK